MLPSLDEYLHAKNLRDWSISSWDIDGQGNLQSCSSTATHPSSSLQCYFPLMIISMKKLKISISSFHFYCWSKNPSICLDRDTIDHIQPKKVVPDATFAWWLSPCKKSSEFLPEILKTKESYNLIAQDAQLTTPNQKR